MATLTQSRLAIAMANQHMAAPSEYQVLQMLLACLRDPTVLAYISPDKSSHSGAEGVVGDVAVSQGEDDFHVVMLRVLPVGLRKSERKALRMVELTDVTAVCASTSTSTSAAAALAASTWTISDKLRIGKLEIPTAEISFSGGVVKFGISIAEQAYRGKCGCETSTSDTTNHTTQNAHLVVLLNRPSYKDAHAALQPLYRSVYGYLYPDKEIPGGQKLERKVSKLVFCGKLFGAVARHTAPSIAVTVLQHFAYHDRLLPAVDLAIELCSSAHV